MSPFVTFYGKERGIYLPNTNGSPLPSTATMVFSRIRHCDVCLLSFSRLINGRTLIETVMLSAIVWCTVFPTQRKFFPQATITCFYTPQKKTRARLFVFRTDNNEPFDFLFSTGDAHFFQHRQSTDDALLLLLCPNHWDAFWISQHYHRPPSVFFVAPTRIITKKQKYWHDFHEFIVQKLAKKESHIKQRKLFLLFVPRDIFKLSQPQQKNVDLPPKENKSTKGKRRKRANCRRRWR